MEIALIWAMTKNRVIGRDNRLPWRLPDEMRHFMRTTMGQPVIMGRRTFESMHKPLPGRANIVMTTRADYAAENIDVVGDFDAALNVAARRVLSSDGDTVFVIGGARIYELALPVAHRLYVTRIDAELEGDTWFPEVDWGQWEEIWSEHHDADAFNEYSFRIVTYIRKQD